MLCFFSTVLLSKQKSGVNFMLGSWQRVNGRKKFANPWSTTWCSFYPWLHFVSQILFSHFLSSITCTLCCRMDHDEQKAVVVVSIIIMVAKW